MSVLAHTDHKLSFMVSTENFTTLSKKSEEVKNKLEFIERTKIFKRADQ
jgi:hypothetical protein